GSLRKPSETVSSSFQRPHFRSNTLSLADSDHKQAGLGTRLGVLPRSRKQAHAN
ncbi:hypothetical protein PGT21_001075, partial [Puccinia graminis f. sp. tritici]